MAALIDAIDVKRKMVFEFENTPYACLDAEVNTPTARGGQTLVRLKMRNLLTSAVFEKTFKAQDKFKEPDLVYVDVSYLYTDGDGSHFLDQESFETLTLNGDMVGDNGAGANPNQHEPLDPTLFAQKIHGFAGGDAGFAHAAQSSAHFSGLGRALAP